jgi:hypothetical protein
MNDYSQYGESKILLDIFEKIGTEIKYVVEFGASDGFWLSNARAFIDLGWDFLLMDGKDNPKNKVKQEFITAENINNLFEKYSVPKKFDLLSIDIDGNDYWVWKELKYDPNVVIIEYNSNFNVNENYVLNYNPNHNFYDSGGYYSASVKSLVELAKEKGYFLHMEVSFTNLIFVKNIFKDILSEFDYKSLNLPVHNHGGKNLEKFINL